MYFDPHDLEAIIKTIGAIQSNVKWKLGKAEPHLAKRIRLGHLPEGSTLANYEEIIGSVTSNPATKVYAYIYDQTTYPTLTATVESRIWLVMIGMDGILETAFPPDNPDRYLSNNPFVYLGILEELLQ